MDKATIKTAISTIATEFDEVPRNTIMYDSLHKHINEVSLLYELIGNLKKPKILDIGAGMGVNLLTLSKLKLDSSLNIIDRFDEYINGTRMGTFDDATLSRFKKYNIEITNQDVIQNHVLPYETGSFDIVTIIDVIEHFPKHPLDVFAEIFRILKKDGFLVIIGPNSFGISEVIKFLSGRHPYIKFENWIKENYYSHYREYSEKEYRKLAELSGFTIKKSFKSSDIFLTRGFGKKKNSIFFLIVWAFLKIFSPFHSIVTVVSQK